MAEQIIRPRNFTDTATDSDLQNADNFLWLDTENKAKKMPITKLAVVSNTAATEADLVSGSTLPIMTDNGPKSLPGNTIAKASEQAALTTYAQNVSRSIATEYVAETGAVAGELYMHEGSLYLCKENTSGDWDSAKFNSINLDTYLRQLQEKAGFASITASSKGLKVVSMLRSIKFYNPQNEGQEFNVYLVTKVAGDSTTLQVSFEKDGNYYGFRIKELSQVGIKSYKVFQFDGMPNNSVLQVSIDWDAYQSVTGGTDLKVVSAFFGDKVVGGGGGSVQNVSNSVIVPKKPAGKAGKLAKIYFRSDVAGTAKILVGSIDSSLKFNVRSRTDVSVEAGYNYIDIASLDIAVKAEEWVGLLTPGKRYVGIKDGSSDSDFAFYYGSESQLGEYSVEGEYSTFDFMWMLDCDLQSQVDVLSEFSVDENFVENAFNEYSIEQLCHSVGFSTSYSTNNGQQVLSFVKKISFCDFENIDADYLLYAVTTVSDGKVLRIIVKYDDVFYDLDVSVPDKTGVKEYVLQKDQKVLRIVMDWDVYQSVIGVSDLFVKSNEFDVLAVGNTTQGSSRQDIKSLLVPCQPVSEDCVITSVYTRSNSAGTAKICVGEVDQLLRFNSFKEFEIEVKQGDNYLDVSHLKIGARKGNYIGLMTVADRYFVAQDGAPTDAKSFYYSTSASNIYQLQEYGVQDKRALFRFSFTYDISLAAQQTEKLSDLVSENENLASQVEIISGSIGFAYDGSGNKYKTRVVDGFVKAFALNFKHVLVVGNSYTVISTDTDAAPLYNNRWWGHWSMAATKKETAWTTLLENNLKARDPSSTVQPIFGRAYEMYGGIDSNDAFVYWDENNELQSLYQNLSSFENTDCVIFFLGDNYNGDDWYSRYKTMVEKFETLFPSALMFCMSARHRSSVNTAILQVATEKSLAYINVYGKAPSSRIGSYVSGDDGTLHQIADNAVAGHPGDYGQKDFVTIVSDAIAVDNIAVFYNVTLNNPSLEIEHTQRQAGAIVSVFGGNSVTSITVMQGETPVEVTAHLATPYGNVFTFIMPAGDVSIS